MAGSLRWAARGGARCSRCCWWRGDGWFRRSGWRRICGGPRRRRERRGRCGRNLSRLRTLAGPDAALIARGGGYALEAGPDQLDAGRFERLARAGAEALEHGEAAAAAARFGEALGLWRGRALADVADVAALAREGARLEELRLVALEGRIEADVELGLAAEVAGELEGLVAGIRSASGCGGCWCSRCITAGGRLMRWPRTAGPGRCWRRSWASSPARSCASSSRAVLRQQVPAAAPRRQQHNLPVRLTSFVGRERDLAALDGLLGQARLVTLTGAGGAGKTRLATEFGAAAAGRFGDGAWLADLAGVTDPGLVPAQVMAALGVRQTGEMPVIEALRYRLRSAELLLVLDNCEHLLGACAALAAALLGSAPGLRVLATSREPLGVPGEAVFPVPPLAVPPEEADPVALAGAPCGPVVPGAQRAGPAGCRGGAGRGGGPDLPGAGRPAAGDRAGRGARGRAVGGGDRGAPGGQVRVPGVSAAGGLRGTRRWGPRSPGAMSYCPPESSRVCVRCRCSREGSTCPRRPWCAAAGTSRPRRTWLTCWPASRWWSPSPPRAAAATGYWRRSASTPPGGWPRRARPGRPGTGTPGRSCGWPSRNAACRSCCASTTTSAPPWTTPWPPAARPGRGWPARWAASGWPGDSSRKGRAGWNGPSPRGRRPAAAR